MFLKVAARILAPDVLPYLIKCVWFVHVAPLLDDPTRKIQVGSNLVTLEAIVLVKLLCLGKMIRLQP
jgi:hypothetical protein